MSYNVVELGCVDNDVIQAKIGLFQRYVYTPMEELNYICMHAVVKLIRAKLIESEFLTTR